MCYLTHELGVLYVFDLYLCQILLHKLAACRTPVRKRIKDDFWKRRPISCIVFYKLWVINNMFLLASGVNFFFFFIIKPSRGFVATFCEAVLVFVSRKTSEIFEYSPTDKKILYSLFSSNSRITKMKIMTLFCNSLKYTNFLRIYDHTMCLTVFCYFNDVITKYTILTKLLVDCVSWT